MVWARSRTLPLKRDRDGAYTIAIPRRFVYGLVGTGCEEERLKRVKRDRVLFI